jgi:hypothetical protein
MLHSLDSGLNLLLITSLPRKIKVFKGKNNRFNVLAEMDSNRKRIRLIIINGYPGYVVDLLFSVRPDCEDSAQLTI